MRPSPARFAPLVLPTVASLLLAATAQAQCPVNTGKINAMFVFGCPTLTSTAPTFSYGTYCMTGSGRISYDLTRGTIYADALGYEGIENYMQTSDDFVIDGPVGGDSVAITVVLDGSLSNCGELRLYSGTKGDTLRGGSGSRRLEIVVQHPVGEHFLIGMFASACSYGVRSVADGALGVAALPPGYSLRSCQGYSGAVVPIRSVSWGQIKTHYR